MKRKGKGACFLLAGGFDLENVPRNSVPTNTEERFCFASKKSKTTLECFQGSSEFPFNIFSTFVYLDILIISASAESIRVYCGKLSSPHDPN